MLIQSLRPSKFSDVVGNQLNNKILMSLAKNPDKGPSTLILQGSFGSGKAIDVDSIIPTFDGFKRAGDISVGDFLYDRLGNPTQVTGVFLQGLLDSYKVTFEDGRIVYCNDEHIWYVRKKGDRSYTTKTLKDIIASGFYNYTIPLNNPINYPTKNLFIHPYALGLLLTKSEDRKTTVLYPNLDSAYIKELESCFTDIRWEQILDNSYKIPSNKDKTFINTQTFFGKYYKDIIENRKIPDDYLFGDIDQRWSLLQGIMDNCGSISGYGNVFCCIHGYSFTKSVLQLCYSLGLIVSPSYTESDYHTLHFKCNINIVKKLFRNYPIPNVSYPDDPLEELGILYVNKEGVQRDMVCFLVDNPEHLFLCTDYIVTHNTTSSRLFAKALNCKNIKDNDICGKCDVCKADLNSVSWYTEFDSSAINVDTIRDMRDIFMSTAKGYKKVVTIDECLNYDQKIRCRDNEREFLVEIGYLVNHRLPVEVLSYNFEKQLFEWKKVIGWHKNSRKPVSTRLFSMIDDKKVYHLTCTDNHRVFRPDGSDIFVGDLNKGDIISVSVESTDVYTLPLFTKATYIGKNDYVECHGVNTYDLTVADNHNYIANGVIVHNCHLLSKTAQAALLKLFEETPKGLYFLLATTDPDKLLPTIRSRSLELVYTPKSKEEVKSDIIKQASRLNLTLDQKTVDLIATRSRGIMRNAHMLLDKVNLLGEEEFLKADSSSLPLLNKYLCSVLKSDRNLVLNTVTELSVIPVSYLKEDWQDYFLNLMRASINPDMITDDTVKKIASMLGKQVVPIVKFCLQDWVIKSFHSSVQAQAALLAIYQSLSKEQK